MIYIAYNLLFYKEKNTKTLEFKNKVLALIESSFPKEEYILPYSQQNKNELVSKLKCSQDEITGQFLKDLKPIISKCSKVVVFPTNNRYIGLGIYWEIMLGIKYGLEIVIYNELNNSFTNKYKLKDVNNNITGKESHIFYKEIEFI